MNIVCPSCFSIVGYIDDGGSCPMSGEVEFADELCSDCNVDGEIVVDPRIYIFTSARFYSSLDFVVNGQETIKRLKS